MRACTGCGVEYPEESFKLRASTGRQAGQRHRQCNRCLYVKYTRPGVEAKTKVIQEFKILRGCDDCGYRKHPEALQFDHRPDEEKEFNIGEEIGNLSMERLLAEIEKCDVVCANCHVERTCARRVLV